MKNHWPNICCTQYKSGGCLHPAAPKSWFERTLCIEAVPFDTKDDRIGTIGRCKIIIPISRPPHPARPYNP